MRAKKSTPVLLIAVFAMILLVVCLVFLPEKQEPATHEPDTIETLPQQEMEPDGASQNEEPPEETPSQGEEQSDLSSQPEEGPAGPEETEGQDVSENHDGEESESDSEEPGETGTPELLVELLEEAGYVLEDLGARQLIVVRSSGNEAAVYAFSMDEAGLWQQDFDKIQGHTGRNGVTSSKVEGDKSTPAGLYTLTQAFGVEADPGSLLPYRRVTQDSYWVDDPDSVCYNQWVEGTEDKNWNSAEHLADYAGQYAYAVVVDYNMFPPVAGKGSAIFLHCGNRATAGCVAVPRSDMLELLLWLDPTKDPAILIF